jgi:hypothetical protein
MANKKVGEQQVNAQPSILPAAPWFLWHKLGSKSRKRKHIIEGRAAAARAPSMPCRSSRIQQSLSRNTQSDCGIAERYFEADQVAALNGSNVVS